MLGTQWPRRDVPCRCRSRCCHLRDLRNRTHASSPQLPFNGEPTMTSMSRRHLMIAATGIAAVAASPRIAFHQPAAAAPPGPFTLDPLAYSVNALEPHIDARTMEIHHDLHHQAYVNNLNNFAKENQQIASMRTA